MATYATLTINAEDIIGADFDKSRASATIEFGSDAGVLDAIKVDETTIRLGNRRESPDAAGLITFANLVTTDSASNPASFFYRVSIIYVPKGSRRQGNDSWRSAWFPLTADADLAAIPEAWDDVAASVLWRSDFRDEVTAELNAAMDAVNEDRAYIEARVVDDLGTTDGQTTALIETPTSATAQALTNTILLVAPTKEQTPTLEETAFTAALTQTSTTTETAVYVAQYPSRLAQVSLAFSAAIGASTSNYWTIDLYRRATAGVSTPTFVARRDTKAGLDAWEPFDFQGEDLSLGTFAPNELLTVVLTPVGSPSALPSGVVTFRAPAADVTPAPAPIVYDNFTRTDSTTTLGSTNNGVPWTAMQGTWGIASGTGYCATPVAGQHNYAVVESNASDCTIEVVMPTIPGPLPSSCNAGLVFRAVDTNNCWFVSREALFRRLSGTSAQQGSSFTGTPIVAGDKVRVVLSGSTIEVYKQTAAAGPWTFLTSTTNTSLQTATKHGLRVFDTSGGAARFDTFRIFA